MQHQLQPGINHMEFWVSDIDVTMNFYEPILTIIGWKKFGEHAFVVGGMEIYFKEKNIDRVDSLGMRHVCYQATSRDEVDQVAQQLENIQAEIIRGPIEQPNYSKGYYTVDFYDPDSCVVEVAYTPHSRIWE